GSDVGGLRVQPGNVRADLSPALRIAGQQPGAGDLDAPGASGEHHRVRAGAAHREGSAARRAPGQGRARDAGTRSRAAAGGARAADGRGDAGAPAVPRAGPAGSRRDVPQAAGSEARRADARREAGDRRGDRLAEAARLVDRVRRRAPGGAAGADGRGALENVERQLREGAGFGPPSLPAGGSAGQPRPAALGDRVAVGPLGLEGIVQSIHDGHADVDVRGKRMRAKIEDLRVLVPAAAGGAPKGQVRVNVAMAPRDGALSNEINVIGANSEEAVGRVERFLDDASVNDLKSLRIIHGYGTGAL